MNRYADTILGFVEEAVEETSDPKNLASRAGGLPVWLYRPPQQPPQAPRCGVCMQPLTFLLQLYCPVQADDVGHENAFHRVLYVMICKQSSCQKKPNCVSVLRAQLPRTNAYYPWDEGECIEEGEAKQCVVCGFQAKRRCGNCGTQYCERTCQAEDWKQEHQHWCTKGDTTNMEKVKRRHRFVEVEIVTDRHPTPNSSDVEEEDEDEDEEEEAQEDGRNSNAEVEESKGMMTELKQTDAVGTMQDASAEELPEDLFRGKREADAAADRFRRIVKYAPDQVIRYCRGGEVVWGGLRNRCTDVAGCGKCGGKRIMEFQIMPQLAYYLERHDKGQSVETVARRLRDGMDWTTIAVFACEKSCGGGGEYVEEVAWLQPGAAGP